MTQNIERLAPIGDFLNESITVNKSNHLFSELKRKEKSRFCEQARLQSIIVPQNTIYNPYKRYAIKLPLEIFQKLAKKFQRKAVQSKTLWPNLDKIGRITFLP